MKLNIFIAFALIGNINGSISFLRKNIYKIHCLASVYSQVLQIDNNCGKGTPLKNVQKRIVGGSYATRGNWGWQVIKIRLRSLLLLVI